METAEWREISGFKGYDISVNGEIRSRRRLNKCGNPRLLKSHVSKGTRYRMIFLRDRGEKTFGLLVHRLVAMSFLEKPNKEQVQVAHLNGIRTDNRVENLKWCTIKENHSHKIEHGTNIATFGETHPFTKFKTQDILDIREMVSMGFSHRAVGCMYDVSHRTIGMIASKKNWKCVP